MVVISIVLRARAFRSTKTETLALQLGYRQPLLTCTEWALYKAHVCPVYCVRSTSYWYMRVSKLHAACSHVMFWNRVVHGRVPERLSSAYPGFQFFFHFFLLLFYALDRVTFCVIITVSKYEGSTVFCKLELHALDKKNVLKIWLLILG